MLRIGALALSMKSFCFRKGSFRPVSYEGEIGIGEILSRLAEKHTMTPISERVTLLA